MLKKLAFVSLVTVSTLFGLDHGSRSLIGIEAGYGVLDYSHDGSGSTPSQSFGVYGVKIGASERSYRLFLDAKIYGVSDDFEYMNSYGAALQYFRSVSSSFNLFLGINGGVINMEFKDNSNIKREISHGYFGGDIGFDYEISDSLFLEYGFRYIYIGASNTKTPAGGTAVKYDVDSLISSYVSIVYKFVMD